MHFSTACHPNLRRRQTYIAHLKACNCTFLIHRIQKFSFFPYMQKGLTRQQAAEEVRQGGVPVVESSELLHLLTNLPEDGEDVPKLLSCAIARAGEAFELLREELRSSKQGSRSLASVLKEAPPIALRPSPFMQISAFQQTSPHSWTARKLILAISVYRICSYGICHRRPE